MKKATRYSLALLIYTILIVSLVYYWARNSYDKPPITNIVKVEVPFSVDSSAIISNARQGFVPYDPKTEQGTNEILGNAQAEIDKLQSIINSFSSMADGDSVGGDSIRLLLPTIESDTTVTWSGVDSLTGTGWKVAVRDSMVVVPLLSEVRHNYSLALDFTFTEADTVFITHKPLIPWYGWVAIGVVGWEIIR